MLDATSPLGARLDARARETFVGREAELARLHGLLDADGPLVVHLHGIPGAGKSTLLAVFAAEARALGVRTLELDCGGVEPTARGFLGALGDAWGRPLADVAEAAAALGEAGGPVLLLLDHYENFLLLDSWLRRELLPAMPDGLRLLLASRQPPVPIWTTAPRWHGLFRSLPLPPLAPEAALALLRSAGLDEGDARRPLALAHGNPLALKLAAAATRSQRTPPLQAEALAEVMARLSEIYLAEVLDPTAREALRGAVVARRITRPLLRALPGAGEECWDALRKLPFVDVWRDGLRVHDAVREALAASLRSADPERYHACRCIVWRVLREELARAPRTELWRTTADLLHLLGNPVLREAFFPSDHQPFAIEALQAADREPLLEIAVRHDGPGSAALWEAWLEARPQALHAVRDGEAGLAGFYCLSEVDELEEGLLTADPVAAACRAHLDEEPLGAGGVALVVRRWLARETGEAPSAEQAASWLDVKRTYMELRPALQRVYMVLADHPGWAPVGRPLGFRHLPECGRTMGGKRFHVSTLDFGPGSVDGWITRLIGDELGLRRAEPLDRQRRAAVIEGVEVPLTPLEYKLAEALENLAGATATRDRLLEEVWGRSDGGGSSNVVDAVVTSLRRKLGPEAGRVETVRGFGYRWRSN